MQKNTLCLNKIRKPEWPLKIASQYFLRTVCMFLHMCLKNAYGVFHCRCFHGFMNNSLFGVFWWYWAHSGWYRCRLGNLLYYEYSEFFSMGLCDIAFSFSPPHMLPFYYYYLTNTIVCFLQYGLGTILAF